MPTLRSNPYSNRSAVAIGRNGESRIGNSFYSGPCSNAPPQDFARNGGLQIDDASFGMEPLSTVISGESVAHADDGLRMPSSDGDR
jgi:hypothetical protein